MGAGCKIASTGKAHGTPLGVEEVKRVKETYGYDPTTFHIPDEVINHLMTLAHAEMLKS